MTDSQQLLAEYVVNGSEAAFGNCRALHQLRLFDRAAPVDGDTHLAEDVTQTVIHQPGEERPARSQER